MKGIALDLGELLAGAGRSRDDEDHDENEGSSDAMRAEMRRERSEDPAIYCRKLLDMVEDHHNRPAGRFKVGDLITAVRGSTYRFFTEKRPGLIVEILPEPVFDNDEKCSSPNFRNPLDIKVAIIRGGELMIFHCNSRCFEKYTGPVLDS